MVNGTDYDLTYVERLFEVSLNLSDAEREAFLTRECGTNWALKRRIKQLLETDAGDGPLDQTLVQEIDFSVMADAEVSRVPEKICQFKVLRVLASGGMGTVYEALQQSPKRNVALKVMRRELSSREALRRFHYESELLAQMQHPGIAQVYEAGVHDEAGLRLPYFAMELVAGATPITRYVAENELDLRTRLNLFAQVCDAVEYGHQRGVIHRDLKPSNIVVGEDGRPRVIDFGVACSTDCDTTLTTLQTESGQLLGTLQYMSPEQCTARREAIDTRSDVYSLGVVLFEVLSGQLPYNLNGMSVYEGTRVVIDGTSTALGSTDKSLRGELETIVHKALERDRNRRYGTAGELAADVRHYLQGEAISARPPSVAYQLKVFARRNKTLVAAAACVLVALVGGLVSTSAALLKADRALKESDQVSSLLSNAFLRIKPDVTPGREPLLREAFEELSQQLTSGEVQFPQDSLREADLELMVGRGWHSLKAFQLAKPHLQRGLEIRQRVLGADTRVAQAMISLARCLLRLTEEDAAYALPRQIVAMYEAGELPRSRVVATAYEMSGWSKNTDKNFEPAAALADFEHAIQISEDLGYESGPSAIANIGSVHLRLGNYQQAREHLEEALRICDRLGKNGGVKSFVYGKLNRLAKLTNKPGEQLHYSRERWLQFKRVYGHEMKRIFHEDIEQVQVWKFFNYVHALEHICDIEASEALLEEEEAALRDALQAKDLSNEHLRWCRCLLGKCLARQGDFDEGREVLTDLHRELVERDVEEERWLEQRVCRELADLYDLWNKPVKAEEWREKLESKPEKQSTELSLLSRIPAYRTNRLRTATMQ